MSKWQIESKLTSTQERFGVQVLGAAIREYAGYEPAVLPQAQGNCIHVAIETDRGALAENSYMIRVDQPQDGVQQACILGADENALMYGCMDFVNLYLPKAHFSDTSCSPYYFYPLFGEKPLPVTCQVSTPKLSHRGLWTWGHAIYDYKGYLENMARLKLNEVIIWNDYLPVNAAEVVEYAHSLGIKVIWGYAWGWNTSIDLDLSDEKMLARAADQVVEQYEREYAASNGDGIYFQSFTETSLEEVNGRLIAEVVVEWVNGIAGRILKRHPNLLLQFGLHASSVKKRLEFIRKTDPRVHIIWEDCGDFPYHYMPSRHENPDLTREFTQSMLTLRPQSVTGAVLKGMICLNWNTFEHQTGPYVMGRASEAVIARRLPEVRKNLAAHTGRVAAARRKVPGIGAPAICAGCGIVWIGGGWSV